MNGRIFSTDQLSVLVLVDELIGCIGVWELSICIILYGVITVSLQGLKEVGELGVRINTNSTAVTGPLVVAWSSLVEARSSVPMEMSLSASSGQLQSSLIGPFVVGRSSFWTARSPVPTAVSFVASSGQLSCSFRRSWTNSSFSSGAIISLWVLARIREMKVEIGTRSLAAVGLVEMTARSSVSTVISFSESFEQSQWKGVWASVPSYSVYIISSCGLKELCELEVVINTGFLAVVGLVGVTVRALVSTVISLSTSFQQSLETGDWESLSSYSVYIVII